MKYLLFVTFPLLSSYLVTMAAPSSPSLIFPPDGTVNVGHAPPLMVRVAEPGGGNLAVRYYGRMAKSPGRDFTIVALPDTQFYTGEMNGGRVEMMVAQTEWAIANRESRNVAYVAHLGDISNNGDTPSYVYQWYNATNAMYRLENPVQTQLLDGMPYGMAVGNHEMTPIGNADSGTTSNYNRYFGVQHFTGREYYAGHYGTNNNNHFDFFSSGGLDFIALYFEYDTTMNAPVLAWANEVLRTNAHRRAILVTHYFGSASTPSTFSTQGAAIYNALKGNTNIFLMLSGHVCGEGYREDTFNGNTIRTLVSDYQCYPNGGNGFMRIMDFSPSNNVVVVQTYSPWLDDYETDEDSEFFFPYDMPPSAPSGEAFGPLHVETGVASGAVASFTWAGLLPNRTYEWYVTVTDEANNTVTGPVWSFTTAPRSDARHDVAAGLLTVSQIPGFSGVDENTNCAVAQAFTVNDFRAGSFDRADYDVQVGPNGNQNFQQGVLIASVTENGRDNYGTNLFGTTGIETNGSGGYRVVTYSSPNVDGVMGSGFGYEYNLSVAGAWFPYATWLGGVVRNAGGLDGGAWNHLTGSPGLVYGTHVIGSKDGRGVVDLRSLGVDSRTDGVLLVNHARDEGNFALSQVNTNDGTWNVFVKDNSEYTASTYEQDPIAFVFIPRTRTTVVSGRFLADGTIAMYSGDEPMFTVTALGTGRWELKISGRTPAEGVLIISAEGGNTYNLDNLVSYAVNADADGWEIQSRDTPRNGLQTPGTAEPVVSFVYVPMLPPGINVWPTDGLATLESGGTASFSVMLDTQPAADVQIAVVSSDPSEGTVSPASLVFDTNNWHVPQTVTITGANDTVLDGNISYQINLSATSADPVYNDYPAGPARVVNLDNEPQLQFVLTEVPYGIGMPGIALDGQAVLLDPGTPTYAGASITLAITNNATASDRLEIRNIGSGPGQVGVSGNIIRYGGVTVGGFSGGIGGQPLVVSFNSASSPEAVQAVLRAITFRNVSDNPSFAPRAVSLTLAKADGGTVSASTSIHVALVRVARFQQGVDHGYGLYTNAADCELSELAPNTPLNTGHNDNNLAIWIDAPSSGGGDACQALLRFGNLVGTGAGQIPPNAVIVSAELILTIPESVANSPGDASPLYRMLVPWDPDAVTWNNAGNGSGGFTPDYTYARSTYDSFFGLSNGDASTGTGTIVFSVTDDLVAWVNGGQANHGWLMPGWQPPAAAAARTDGTAFAACEWDAVAERPLLRVMWVPNGTGKASFRQGENGYTAAQDTRIRASSPDTPEPTTTSLYSDWTVSASGDNEHVLLRFDDIIGLGTGQVPPGARIDAAVLELASVVGNAMGDGGQFFRLLKPWQDTTSTWNSWVNGIQINGIEAPSVPTALAGNPSLDPNVQAAFVTFDLTPDVQIWAHGSGNNYGWVILPWTGGADGWGFASAEIANERHRPQLRVFYTTPGQGTLSMLSPVHGTSQVRIHFRGVVGTACSVQRANTPGGAWITLGSAIVGQDGTGTFIDAAPLAEGAFYRVRFP